MAKAVKVFSVSNARSTGDSGDVVVYTVPTGRVAKVEFYFFDLFTQLGGASVGASSVIRVAGVDTYTASTSNANTSSSASSFGTQNNQSVLANINYLPGSFSSSGTVTNIAVRSTFILTAGETISYSLFIGIGNTGGDQARARFRFSVVEEF